MLPQALEHLGQTGVVAIDDGRAAFGARVALLRTAARSVDIQTFIWRADNAGTLLFEEVVRAAERGVRMRLLLDDLNTAGTDPTLALLASHANSELRLYNPFVGRGSRAIGLLADFTRLNHRMHNKSFTVDNVVTLVGGRNIADEYYEIGETGLVDLDIVAVGAVVQAVSNEFDLFWNSASAYPARSLIADVTPQTRDALAQRAQAIRAGSQAPNTPTRCCATTSCRGWPAGASSSSGRWPTWCSTTPPRRWPRATTPSCSCCPSCTRGSARRSSRSI